MAVSSPVLDQPGSRFNNEMLVREVTAGLLTATRDRPVGAGDCPSAPCQALVGLVRYDRQYLHTCFSNTISPRTIKRTTGSFLCVSDEETEIHLQICSRPQNKFPIQKLICFLLQLSCEVKTPISSQLVAVEMMAGVTEVRSLKWKSSFMTHERSGYGKATLPINVGSQELARVAAFSPT